MTIDELNAWKLPGSTIIIIRGTNDERMNFDIEHEEHHGTHYLAIILGAEIND